MTQVPGSAWSEVWSLVTTFEEHMNMYDLTNCDAYFRQECEALVAKLKQLTAAQLDLPAGGEAANP